MTSIMKKDYKVISELYCPLCGEKMEADVGHDKEIGEKGYSMDVWVCMNDEVCGNVVMDREELKNILADKR